MSRLKWPLIPDSVLWYCCKMKSPVQAVRGKKRISGTLKTCTSNAKNRLFQYLAQHKVIIYYEHSASNSAYGVCACATAWNAALKALCSSGRMWSWVRKSRALMQNKRWSTMSKLPILPMTCGNLLRIKLRIISRSSVTTINVSA